jgi:opacity protein-like surface antigen
MRRFLMALAVAALAAWPAAAADGCYGTTVEFVDTPKEAAALAKKQEKLVFVLHVSGHFEDPGLT